MAVKIRLQRVGTKKKPFYRVVAVDEHVKRGGSVLENLGEYQPISKDNQFSVKEDRVIAWIRNGALPTDTVSKYLKKQGIWQKAKAKAAN